MIHALAPLAQFGQQSERRLYRLAFAMGQLDHKNLTLGDASETMYCWVLLNVEQSSYGWSRTLIVPDLEHGGVCRG